MIAYDVQSDASKSGPATLRKSEKISYLFLRQGGRLGPLLIAIIATIFAIEAQQRQFGTLQAPGPAMWPTSIGILTVGLSVAAAFVSRDTPSLFRPKGLLRVLLYVVAMGVFVLLYPTVGFLLSAWLMCFVMLFLAARVKWYISMAVAIVASIVVYILFGSFLELPVSPWP